MKFKIVEFDNDYHQVVDWSYKEFKDLKEAKKWCRKNSWTGCDYFVDTKVDDGPDYP